MATRVEPTQDWVFDDDIRARVDAIFSPWDTVATPGCALGIYREGELVYAHGYGMSNLEHGIPIVPSSIFHIASISKQFTDMCIALLASEGAIDIDDDIRLYVPEVPDFGITITIRHLIHHVSGLRDQWSLLELAGWREEDLVTEQDVMDLVTRQTALNFNPNEEYLYCNTGYTLLSMIVKRVSGLTLREFSQQRIFAPLGMTRTHFQDDHSEIVQSRTQAYEPRKGGGYRISIPEFDVVGTTSLFTTVEDLAKWDANFTTGQIGGPEIIQQIQTPGTFNNGKPMAYAWGLLTETYRGTPRVGHSGADHGYRAEYLRLPEFGFTVTCLANVSNSNPRSLAERVADAVLGDMLAPKDGTCGMSQFARGTRKKAIPIIVPESLEGIYHHDGQNTYLTITSRDGRAWLEVDEQLELTTVGNGRFTIPAPWNLVLEVLGETSPPDRIGVSMGGGAGGDVSEYTRIPRWVPTTADIDAYAGNYWSDELAVSYELIADHAANTLTLRRRKSDDLTFVPLAKDVFGRGSLQFGTVLVFDREKKGKIGGFLLTAGRIRNLRFTRHEG
ncbi:MAG: serine hydrolase domain-containing protein [Thermomicrobiales bacterium]